MVYSLGGGGVERMRIHLAEALHERGYTTAIVVARGYGPYRSQIPPGVGLVDLNACSWKAWLDSLTAYLRTEQPRVLLAAMETAGVVALWARRRARVGTRVVISSHVAISRHIRGEPKRLKRIIVPYLVRRLYPSADGLVAVSHGVADDLAQFARVSRDRIQVTYNPVVTEQLMEAARQYPRSGLSADDSCPLIVGVGRLTEQKDFGTLLRSFAKVRDHRAARLMILGEGSDRKSLETLARELGVEEHVRMPGFVANPLAYMAAASVFVLSSAWEGFGNALVEALACGCPVVATDCPSGPREILADGKYGLLVPVGDDKALANAILETLSHPSDPSLLKARAMDFHVDRVIGRYIEVMELVP